MNNEQLGLRPLREREEIIKKISLNSILFFQEEETAHCSLLIANC